MLCLTPIYAVIFLAAGSPVVDDIHMRTDPHCVPYIKWVLDPDLVKQGGEFIDDNNKPFAWEPGSTGPTHFGTHHLCVGGTRDASCIEYVHPHPSPKQAWRYTMKISLHAKPVLVSPAPHNDVNADPTNNPIIHNK